MNSFFDLLMEGVSLWKEYISYDKDIELAKIEKEKAIELAKIQAEKLCIDCSDKENQ